MFKRVKSNFCANMTRVNVDMCTWRAVIVGVEVGSRWCFSGKLMKFLSENV